MNIILVDDEVLMIEALKKIIRDSVPGIDVAGEAYDGSKALELMERLRPDLAIVDIRMPKMDGLQLINELKEKGFKTKILILSAYRDFEYAQKALQFGASGYLVKPVDKSKLLEEIGRVKQIIQDENNIAAMMGIAAESLPLMKANYLRQLLRGSSHTVGAGPKDRGLIDIEDTNCKLILVVMDPLNSGIRFPLGAAEELQIIDDIESLLQEKTKAAAFFTGQDELAILFNPYEETDELHMAEIIRAAVRRLFPLDMDIGLCKGSFPLTALADAYREAKEALVFRFYLGPDSIIPYRRIEQIHFENDPVLIQQEDYLIGQIKMGLAEEVKRIFSSICVDLEESMNAHPDSVYKAFYNLMLYLRKTLKDSFADKELDELLPRLDLEDLKRHQTLGMLSAFILQQLLRVTSYIEYRRRNEDSRLIEKVKRYCEENYARDITLEAISDHINMAKNYFCSVFKKKTGESFWEYLTNLRVSKARILLEKTELKIGVISERVGYKNSSHFCRVFKETVGVSPAEYKQKFLEKKPEA